MHIKKKKHTNFKKGTKKRWEKLELQKRKSNLFNEKLELIKISKYTQKIYTHTAALCIDSKEGKQWPKTTQHGLSVKGRKKPKRAHAPTHAPTLSHPETEVFFNSTLSLQQAQIQSYFTMLPFLIQKMPVWVYIYIFSGLLLTYFKYISVTTCSRGLYRTAFPFIYLHGTSATYRQSRGRAGGGGLFSESERNG